MKPTTAQLRALKRRDPALAAVMKGLPSFPSFPVEPRLPYFNTLARTVIFQQLATGAAQTIYGRVKVLGPNPRRFPTPAELLSIPDEKLRGAGLSRSKLKAIQSLAERVESGELKLRSLSHLPDEEVTRQITAVWGLGEWSAQMFLLFHLGRLDVFAPGDLGLQGGIKILDGLDERPTSAAAQERAEVWAPLRSVASWYLWRLKDGGEF